METIGELVARDRRSRDLALRAAVGATPEYDYYQFCTTAQKTGNFLRHFGVGSGKTVAVATGPGGAPLLALFGAARLGARTRFDPPRSVDARVLIAPAEAIDAYDLPAGRRRIAYGGEPSDPSVERFASGVWSENPACPILPEVTAESTALVDGDRSYAHAALLDAAARVADRLDSDDEVAIRAALSRPETIVAGVLAPLSVGATIVRPNGEERGTVAVTDGDAPEPRSIALSTVSID